MDVQFNTDKTISLLPVPKRVRKLTGTRFASVLGLNKWNTPFQTWCEITGAYRVPFEDTIYTRAGKAIEPSQITYMREAYGMDNLIDPTDVWGPDPFSKTYGNFYTHKVFGGMWDSLMVDEDWDGSVDGLKGHTEAVLEFKTTKRAEDWAEDVPEYYALQAALYAWLLDCDDVIMVASFLQEGDYDDPESFVPSAENTATYEFRISERYPDFESDYIVPALDWWAAHVESGESPEFDEIADRDYLKPLRDAHLNPTSDVDGLLEELHDLNTECSIVKKQIAAKEKRITAIKGQLKKFAQERIGDKRTATIEGGGVTCTLARSITTKLDEDAMKSDGVYEKYAREVESERFTVKFA